MWVCPPFSTKVHRSPAAPSGHQRLQGHQFWHLQLGGCLGAWPRGKAWVEVAEIEDSEGKTEKPTICGFWVVILLVSGFSLIESFIFLASSLVSLGEQAAIPDTRPRKRPGAVARSLRCQPVTWKLTSRSGSGNGKWQAWKQFCPIPISVMCTHYY